MEFGKIKIPGVRKMMRKKFSEIGEITGSVEYS
jgi:hypothetical protein